MGKSSDQCCLMQLSRPGRQEEKLEIVGGTCCEVGRLCSSFHQYLSREKVFSLTAKAVPGLQTPLKVLGQRFLVARRGGLFHLKVY